MPKILVVDDERAIRRTLREILEYEKYSVDEVEDGEMALEKIANNQYDVILMDIKMPKKDGIEVLQALKEQGIDVPIIMISGHGNLDTAVEAVKKGAFDYLPKPPDLNKLLITVRNALDKSSLITETKVLKKKLYKAKEIVGESISISKIKDMIARVAPTDARVLITGDNGSGKELVAQLIHAQSMRAHAPLIEVNCAAIPSELIESELFGHEKGAFTGADKQKIGKFEQANGGSIFLDEVGDMSLSAQAKVLRALQENKVSRVGSSDKEIKVDVRVIAATNKDLKKEIEQGRFREDLYHRLCVIHLQVPSLNQRKEDIPLIIEFFIQQICADYGWESKGIDNEAVHLLQQRNWTGNIRELRNVIERLIILSGKNITAQDVRDYCDLSSQDITTIQYDRFNSLQQFGDYAEKLFIEYHLDKNDWDTQSSAQSLQISKDMLTQKMNQYGLIKR
jgi:two-component system nitrogen regulation response regulator NtrX